MKVLIGILLALNFIVFLLANFASQNPDDGQTGAELDSNMAGIEFVTSSVLEGNCTSIGPISDKNVLEAAQIALDEKETSYRIISEAPRKLLAYRVVLPVSNESEIETVKQNLRAAGVEEFFAIKQKSGDPALSLGVFTYQKTAVDLASSLSNASFPAQSERELLEYPARYWLNLDKSPDHTTMNTLNELSAKGNLSQSKASCR